jgi:Predicted membrane protein
MREIMYPYTVTQWLFFFYFYCFFGWCFESSYVSLKNRRRVNRGFMRGPFLPLYGSGAIMMLVASSPFQSNLFLTYLAGCIGATALEYVTGVAMEALFKVRYWDYSNQRFNFQGHICLSSTLAWGGLTILMTRFVHKPVERLVLGIGTDVLTAAVILLTVCLAVDFTLSFRAAIDLRDILVKMETVREELERVQKRLDVIIALSNEERGIKRQERSEKLDELTANIEKRLQHIRERMANGRAAYPDNVREEITELLVKYKLNLENRGQLTNLKEFYKRMLKGNPTMASGRFKEFLQELKEKAEKE